MTGGDAEIVLDVLERMALLLAVGHSHIFSDADRDMYEDAVNILNREMRNEG